MWLLGMKHLLLNNFEENIYQPGLELSASSLVQLRDGLLVALSWTVGPVYRHSVIGIGYGQDSSAERYLLTLKPVRIALAIPTLMVRANNLNLFSKERQ